MLTREHPTKHQTLLRTGPSVTLRVTHPWNQPAPYRWELYIMKLPVKERLKPQQSGHTLMFYSPWVRGIILSKMHQLYSSSWKLLTFGSYPKLMPSNSWHGRNILPWLVCPVTMYLKKNQLSLWWPTNCPGRDSFLIKSKTWVLVLFFHNISIVLCEVWWETGGFLRCICLTRHF